MDLELSNKVIAITGGSDGLGFGLAERLLAEGAAVAICSRRDEGVQMAVEQLQATAGPGRVLGLALDVTDPDAGSTFASAVLETFGRCDGLVNNAGRSAAAPIGALDDGAWHDDLDLKLFGAIRMTRAFTAALTATRGSILNVLAISGKHPGASSSPTSVSRAAGLAFTKAASKDLGPSGVRVNAVLIGLIHSGQWVRAAAAQQVPVEELEAALAHGSGVPLGRMGSTAEFADLAAFILSPRASYLTGVGINLDGGLSSAV